MYVLYIYNTYIIYIITSYILLWNMNIFVVTTSLWYNSFHCAMYIVHCKSKTYITIRNEINDLE